MSTSSWLVAHRHTVLVVKTRNTPVIPSCFVCKSCFYLLRVSGMASTQSNGKYLKTSSSGFRTSKPAAEPSLWYILAPSLQQLLLEISQHRKAQILKLDEIRIAMVEFEKVGFSEGQRHQYLLLCTSSAAIDDNS